MNRLKEITKGWTWADYGVMSLITVFALANNLMPVLMILTALSLFINRNSMTSVKHLLSLKFPFIWFILFFVIHVVGLIYSSNMDEGIMDVGMKLSLLGIPLFLVFTKLKLRFNDIVNAYLIALLLTTVVCYSYAIFRSIYNAEDNHWAYFTESYFSFMMHRSYFGTYLALGTLITVVQFFESKKYRLFYVFSGIVFLISNVLTFSKAGILIMIVLMLPLGYYLVARYYGRIKAVVAMLVFLLGVTVLISTSGTLKARFGQMVKSVTSQEKTNVDESNAARVIMWSVSLDVMREHLLLGVGTGDIKDELNRRNLELGNISLAEKNLNSHNQYLNTGAQLGLLGLIPLVMMFLTSFLQAVRRRSIILALASATFVLTLLFESFLERQFGLIPVTLFLLLFVLLEEHEEMNKTVTSNVTSS